jgi:hypothetical protein
MLEGRDGPSKKQSTKGQTGEEKCKFKHLFIFLINSSVIHPFKGSGNDNCGGVEEVEIGNGCQN